MKSILLNFLLESHIEFFTDYEKRILKDYVTCPQSMEMLEDRYGDTLQEIESQLLSYFSVDFDESCSVQHVVYTMCQEFDYRDIIQYLDDNNYLYWLSIREGLFLGILKNREQRMWQYLTIQEIEIIDNIMKDKDAHDWMILEYEWLMNSESLPMNRWSKVLWKNAGYIIVYLGLSLAGVSLFMFIDILLHVFL